VQAASDWRWSWVARLLVRAVLGLTAMAGALGVALYLM
jgi:hypothetical protein